MNQINYVKLIASAIFASAASGLTATGAQFNILGSNGWVDGWGSGTPDYATDVFTGGASALSGNAALFFDHVDGDPGRGVEHDFATPLTGQVDIKYNLFIPTGHNGGWFNAYIMTDAGGNDATSWGGTYAQTGGCWIEEWSSPGVTGPGLTRGAWQEIKMHFDFTAGTAQYFKDGVALGSPTPIAGTSISGFAQSFQESYMGGDSAFTGPIYFDNFSVVNNGTTVWSDNFDSYITAGDPNLISLDVVANGSVAVSGSVAGGLPGQGGLWNELPLDGGTISLSSLTNGAGTSASGVGFVFDSAGVGYHVQAAQSPYNPGIVVGDYPMDPERSWITGGDTPVTFKFTGLTVGGNYKVAIYTTGDPLMTLTVNGTPTLDPGVIFTATTTADVNGEIVCQVSCGGSAYVGYAEIAGIQLLKLTTAPPVVANAGADKALSPSTPSATLGGSPSASGGTGPYTYAWSPSTGLDDATLANPTVTTTAATTTYTLTVTDSLLATATDTVVVTYGVPALVASAGADQSVSPGSPSVTIGGSPSASGGSGTYFYSWSPSTGLNDPTAANPIASPTATTTYTLTVTDSLGTPQATDSAVVTYVAPPPGSPNLVSIDVVRTNSTAVSGDVTGSPFTGQSGLWNRLVGGDPPAALSGLINGDGGTTAIGLTSVFSGRHGFQGSGSVTGVVLAANDPERLWVSTNGKLTLTFTGLTAGGSYNLAIYNTGSSQGVITINGGTPHTGFSTIFTSSEVADGSGAITIVVSFSGAVENDYMEVSGIQIEAVGAPPSGYSTWATTYAGGQTPGEDFNHDGVQNGIAYFMGMNGLATNPGVVNGKVTWPHVGDVSAFEVQVSTDLVTWSAANPANVDTTSSPGYVIFTLPTGAADEFCRLVVTP